MRSNIYSYFDEHILQLKLRSIEPIVSDKFKCKLVSGSAGCLLETWSLPGTGWLKIELSGNSGWIKLADNSGWLACSSGWVVLNCFAMLVQIQ